ncbi:MAG TPA: sigma-70 family RNA polymerase sigma factor, partial [Candidatus Polarisedimenticolia bacterium]|nr:sigma-70 family RNA polymerase sigma factor [Candidatus Polarisedimenticolia bacterium]
HRIAANLSIDLLRRERPYREATTLDAIHEPSAADGAAGVPAGAPRRGREARESPTDEALRSREVQRVFTVLSSLLTRKQRLAFVLREIEGLSTSEVAEIMKTRESTIRNHILQARRILQEEMRRRYPEYCRPRPGTKDS